jgi:urease accessory protein
MSNLLYKYDECSLQEDTQGSSARNALDELPDRLKLSASLSPSVCLKTTNLHTLALLADSALPLGSFAFSSGLESFLAHRRLAGRQGRDANARPAFRVFLELSLTSLAGTALPYVLAAYRHPESIEDLDNDLDASTPCTVARRASIAQGRALLSVWERSFFPHMTSPESESENTNHIAHLRNFAAGMRASGGQDLAPNAHFAPLWGLVNRIMGIDEASTVYLFLFGHARTIISAAVRASELGPYQAQSELADPKLRTLLEGLISEYWNMEASDAAQCVPVIDLWIGRHEKLYSRIFNS